MMPVSQRTRLIFGITLIAASIVIFPALNGSKRSRGPAAAIPIPILAATAATKDVSVVIREIGTVEAINAVAVTSRIGGQLQHVAFDEGRDVTKGDLLFRIDPAPYEAALGQTIETFKRDSISMVNAENNAGRYKDLAARDFVTKQDFEAVNALAAEARALVAADRALIENARLNLGYCTIRAPISGRTGNLLFTAGNLIVANSQTPLVTINQISPIYVRFALPETRLGDIRHQAQEETLSVNVTLPHDSIKIPGGKLTFIDNSVDQTTGTILFKATFPNTNRSLWPGQFVLIGLVLGKQAKAVVVPSSAIQLSQQGQYLYAVMPGDTVQLRKVVTGTTEGDMTVIEQGVRPGETVVIDGMLQLRQGARIMIKTGLLPASGAREAKKG